MKRMPASFFFGGVSEDSREYNEGKPGNCYMAAINLLTWTSHNFTVCHGVVTCSPKGEVSGKRIMHAWVECEFNDIQLAIDASCPTRPTLLVLRANYYEHGKINCDTVRRYSREAAIDVALATGRAGPWQPPLEPAIDWDAKCDAKIGIKIFPKDFDIERPEQWDMQASSRRDFLSKWLKEQRKILRTIRSNRGTKPATA